VILKKSEEEKDNLTWVKRIKTGLLRELQAPSGAGWDVFELFLHREAFFLIISDGSGGLISLNHNRS